MVSGEKQVSLEVELKYLQLGVSLWRFLHLSTEDTTVQVTKIGC